MITITEIAAKKVLEIISGDPELEGHGFRLGIQGAGCAGFQYMFGMDEPSDDDMILESNGVKVIIDPMSYQ
jgi:iron-sulfur cluster assembly accessory protein